MITYLLKSASCLALLLVFYHLVLEREKMHNFNRFYLLGSVLFSFLVPLFIIYITVNPEEIFTTVPIVTEQFLETNSIEYIEPINYTKYVIILSILISSILSIRFIKNIIAIHQKIKKNKRVKHQNATLVLVDDNITPHTFWNYIFINKNEYNSQKIEEELFTHELTHATQKHTFDVLLIEVLKIVFWFNPIFYFLKKSIQLNHEFLADTKVVSNHKNIPEYQYLLLNKTTWNNEYYLASNLNYLLTKKRLVMMTKQSSQTKILLKQLAVIPLLAGFIFLFAERVEAQENTIEEIVEEVPTENNLDNSDFYKEYVYRNGYTTVKDKNGKKIKKKYSELTKEEKRKLPPPPPLRSKKKVPVKKTIEDLKDSKKYALWIDDNVVKNSVLNNYNYSDFSNYFISFVHKNARSKLFPQKYQANLYTNEYFKNQNKKRADDYLNYLEKEHKIEVIEEQPYKATPKEVAEYNALAKKYNKQPKETRVVKLKDLKRLEYLYAKLSKKQKKNAQPFPECALPPPPPPKPGATKEESIKAKKAYSAWKKKNNGNFIPPPPPRNHLDQVIKMAKKGAKFYYEGERIDSDKAIKLLKENKRLNIHSKSTNNSNYEVWLSKKPIVKEIKVKDKKPKKTALIKTQKKATIDKINSLTNKQILKLSKDQNIKELKYFLNSKPISKRELDTKIKPNQMKTIHVKKEKDGSGSIYITSK